MFFVCIFSFVQELVKYSSRLGENVADLQKALELMLIVPHRAINNKFLASIEGYRGNSQECVQCAFVQTKFIGTLCDFAFEKLLFQFLIFIFFFCLTITLRPKNKNKKKLKNQYLRMRFDKLHSTMTTSMTKRIGNIHKLGRLIAHEWWTVNDKEGKTKERYLFLFKSRILVCKVRRISEDRSVFVLKDIIKVHPYTHIHTQSLFHFKFSSICHSID